MDETTLQARPGEVRFVRVDDVVVPEERMRQLGDFEPILESIRDVGLIAPIILRRDTKELISGLHRLESIRALGHEQILARLLDVGDVEAELIEIDENLARVELTALERAEHVLQRKQIYEAIHPEARRGGAPGKAGGGKEKTVGRIASFVADTSRKTGLSPRTLQEDAQVARLVPAVRAAVRGTFLENRKRDLVTLSRMPLKKHLTLVRMVLKNEATTIQEAAEMLGLTAPRPRRRSCLQEADEVPAGYELTSGHEALDELERQYPKFARSPKDAEIDRELKRTGLAFTVLEVGLTALARLPDEFVDERNEVVEGMVRLLNVELPKVYRFFTDIIIYTASTKSIVRESGDLLADNDNESDEHNETDEGEEEEEDEEVETDDEEENEDEEEDDDGWGDIPY